MSRGGVSKTRGDEPERRCIATGDVQPRSGLIRFVLDPDGVVVPDLLGKLPGRGVYVAADRAALETTVKKALFSRGFKQPAKAAPELIDQIDAMLIRRVTDLISLARKSGDAIAGYEKVKDWLMRETAHVLIQASDGSERGKSKLSTPYKGVFIGFLTADELGLFPMSLMRLSGLLNAVSAISTMMARKLRKLRPVCSRSVFNMRWITWKAHSSSITCRV